jgi:thioester reductase-like protein
VTAIENAPGLRLRLAVIVAQTLRVPIARVQANVPFARLGMDSLGAVELTTAIEDGLGVALAMTAVHEHPTLERLVRSLESDNTAAAPSVVQRMRADAELPTDLEDALGALRHGQPVCARHARHILVTGATGFLGAHLVSELLQCSGATLHCLVRPGAGSVDRVQRQLEHHGLWNDAHSARLRVVAGDLERSAFGMSRAQFTALAAQTEVVYHAAAAVNWIHGYDSLRAANVLGTREIIRFASTGNLKPVHFISSIGVCYSTRGPRALDETANPLDAAAGLHLGYAQSKCVAESLMRAAGALGLPVTISRPALLSGHSVSGRGHGDDLVARFIAGCIRLGCAPDLDWRMDCLPVDFAARAMVGLSLDHARGVAISSLLNDGARHWRECVLWMRLRGYALDLVPYAEWQMRLRRTSGADHPLHPLRSFFLHGVPAEGGLTLPELYEESRRTTIVRDDSRQRVVAAAGSCPELDAPLLDRYFQAFIANGTVPSYPCASHPAARQDLCEVLAARLATIGMQDLTLQRLGGDASIVAELTSWRHGTDCGLYLGRATSRANGRKRVHSLFVKAKPTDEQVLDVGEAVASLASPGLGACYRRFRGQLGFARCHERELALYQEGDERVRRNQPVPVWIEADASNDRWVLVLEAIENASLLNATDASRWDPRAIGAAIHGLAEIHAAWLGRERELRRQPWIGAPRDREQLSEMLPLWTALASHARDHNAAWADHELVRAHDLALSELPSWSTALDQLPRTLIHNDFNPRNVAMCESGRGLRLCAFDWELATIGVPQRDLAEFLCFVLPSSASRDTVSGWLEVSRRALEHSSGRAIDPSEWETGFRAALCELLVDRLSTYAMVDRIRSQRFLPGVMRSWQNLHRAFPWITH